MIKRVAILIIPILVALTLSLTVYLMITPIPWPSDAPVWFTVGPQKGCFTALNSHSMFDPCQLSASKIDCSIPVKTIFTGRADFDEQVLEPVWFDAARYPSIAFKSTRIQRQSGCYLAEGDLTLKGVTKRVFLPFNTQLSTNGRTILAANLRIKPQDYGFGINMKNEVIIAISIPASDLSLAAFAGSNNNFFVGNGVQSRL